MNYALLSNPKTNYYSFRRKRTRLIVVHVTAGIEDLDMLGLDVSAQKTNHYGATTSRSASWHSCVDSDSIEPALPENYTAFHCQGYNSMSLGLEICNTDARWDNKSPEWTEATLLNAAKVCLGWEKRYGIPRVLLTKEEVDAGKWGYSYHMFLDPTRRRDPGVTFPWEYFVSILENLDSGQGAPALPPVDDKAANRAKTKKIQKLLGLAGKDVDGLWGSRTDQLAHLMWTACKARMGYPVNAPAPHHKEGVQSIVGVTADGVFGPKSQAALHAWLKEFQKVLGVSPDGEWGPATEGAFHLVRNANRNNF